MSPWNGPHLSLVTQTWSPQELSTPPLWLSHIRGLGISSGSGLDSVLFIGRWAEVTTPRNWPCLTQCSGLAGTQEPSLSPVVTWPLGPTHMPLGARRPVAKCSMYWPSLL